MCAPHHYPLILTSSKPHYWLRRKQHHRPQSNISWWLEKELEEELTSWLVEKEEF